MLKTCWRITYQKNRSERRTQKRVQSLQTPAVSQYYASMSDSEIVGHVGAIPDASELSQALATRVKLLVTERDRLDKKLRETERALLSLQLGLAEDKLDAYQDLIDRQSPPDPTATQRLRIVPQ